MTDKMLSRKYRLALYALVCSVVGWILGGFNPVLASMYGELITGIGAVLMLYYGSNVGNKYVAMKGEQSHGPKQQ